MTTKPLYRSGQDWLSVPTAEPKRVNSKALVASKSNVMKWSMRLIHVWYKIGCSIFYKRVSGKVGWFCVDFVVVQTNHIHHAKQSKQIDVRLLGLTPLIHKGSNWFSLNPKTISQGLYNLYILCKHKDLFFRQNCGNLKLVGLIPPISNSHILVFYPAKSAPKHFPNPLEPQTNRETTMPSILNTLAK